MARKENKFRPYRIDYFDIEEMKENDLALVKSVVVRAVTAIEAEYQFLEQPEFWHGNKYPSLVVIRSYRFYKTLGPRKKDVYKAVEDLFTANKAVKIMEQVELYRDKKQAFLVRRADQITDPANNGHRTRLSDSSLYDEVCMDCGATDAGGKLDQPCPAATPATVVVAEPTVTINLPTTGPDSPATKAAVADLQGMMAHDAHEQTMDTFVPDSIPEGKRFPDPTNIPITEQPVTTLPAVVPVPAGRAPTSWTYGLNKEGEPLIEPDRAVGCSARPAYLNPPPCPEAVGEVFPPPLPLWVKIAVFCGTLTVIFTIMYLLLHTR